jgi:hypothetical protein
MEDKKIFIYSNIHKIKYHNEIIKYIKSNDIKYTENSNGFFVNISLIDDHINNIYNILQYIIYNNNENNEMNFKKQELIDNKPDKKNNKDNSVYNIELNKFDKKEQQLILLSKKYKFDN